jgi:hypothetical protein
MQNYILFETEGVYGIDFSSTMFQITNYKIANLDLYMNNMSN